MINLTIYTALEIVLRTVIVYLVILLGLRLAGKREIGQMTEPFYLTIKNPKISPMLCRTFV